jgi:hypothetical protein
MYGIQQASSLPRIHILDVAFGRRFCNCALEAAQKCFATVMEKQLVLHHQLDLYFLNYQLIICRSVKGKNGRTKMLVVSSPFLRCIGKIEKCYGSHHISSLAPISLLNQAREIPFLSSISVVPFSLVCVSPLPSTP